MSPILSTRRWVNYNTSRRNYYAKFKSRNAEFNQRVG